MYIVACARCQSRLTETVFASYVEATEAAQRLGYPAADGKDELWCAECATVGRSDIDLRGANPDVHRRTA